MSAANDPAQWQNFYLMMGTANAAITGLLFVAISNRLHEILGHPLLRPRAVTVLIILTLQIVVAAIVLAPQPRQAMGLEILLLNVFFLAINLRQGVGSGVPGQAAVTVALRAAYMYSALSTIAGIGGGFYILALALIATLARSMAGCWTLLTALEKPA